MKRLLLIIGAIAVFSNAHAQTWTQVFTIPQSTLSCASFFNASEGVIGTGNYFGGARANIYFTTDAGRTWERASMPSTIVGQVNEIYFRDATHGWATITEATQTGWSGIYRTTDRGRSWRLVHQAGFPVGIRETSRGVFYADRDINPGVYFSSDQGLTWRSILSLNAALDIDFYDDDNGFVTSQAYGSPPGHAATTDGGLSWHLIATNAECWSVAANPRTKSFILASEQTNGGTGSSTSLLTAFSSGSSETTVHFDPPFGITGGVRVYTGCSSIAYAQIRKATGSLQPGFLRSTNDGANWSLIDGPCNRADTRFAVTGRGAVLVAGDSAGGVWRTTEAAGSGVSFSVLHDLQIVATTSAARAYICDSITFSVRVSYTGCDSIHISRASIDNDTLSETRVLSTVSSGLQGSLRDSIVLRFRPKSARTWTAKLRVSIVQPDGYAEDTVISLLLLGLQPSGGSVNFTTNSAPATELRFDSVPLCSTAAKAITLRSTSCYDLHVTGIRLTGPFRLRSSFTPFTFSPDDERSFLIEYSPTTTNLESGSMIVTHDEGTDTLLLSGRGISPRSKLTFPALTIRAAECDSATLELPLTNVTCSMISQVSVTNGRHLNVDPIADSIAVGASLATTIRFAPGTTGSGHDTLHVHFVQLGVEYDTTVIVFWEAKTGTPRLGLGADELNFGVLSPCATSETDTIVVFNSGCGELTLSSSIDDNTQGFRITRNVTNVAGKSSDTIIIHYTPAAPGSSANAHVILRTNAGDTTILLHGSVATGNGVLSAEIDSVIPVLTCQSSTFSIRLQNATCDSLYLISEEVQNTSGSDFQLTSTASPLSRDQSIGIPILFQPIVGGTATATVVLHFARSDGSHFDTTFNVTGLASEPPAVMVYMPVAAYVAQAGKAITLPIFVTGTTSFPVHTIELAIAMNTDLLTPIAIVSGRGQVGDASLTSIKIKKDSATLQLTLPTERVITTGLLVEIQCRAFVTSTLSTPITLQRSTFDNSESQSRCLPTSLPDSIAQFTLDAVCGDQLISRTLETGKVVIDAISPNPARSDVVLHLTSTIAQDVDAWIEVTDALGERIQELPIRVERGESDVTVTLTGSEGVRFISIETRASGAVARSASRSVVLQK